MPKSTRERVTTPGGVEATIRRLTAFDFLETGDLPDLFAGVSTPEQGAQIARRDPAKLRELYKTVLTKGVLRYGEGRILPAAPHEVPDESPDVSWEEMPDAESGFLFQAVMRFTGGGTAASKFPAEQVASATPGPDGATVFDLTLQDAAGATDRPGG